MMQPVANSVYRQIWERRGCALLPGDEVVPCAKDSRKAQYDVEAGIDVVLRFNNGAVGTMQEKFLTTTFRTLTVEHMQDWSKGIQGDWFKMRCQYYFVGYYNSADPSVFTDWVLVRWPDVQLYPRVRWQERRNGRDGARASLRYVPFEEIPAACIVGASWALVDDIDW